MTNPISSNMIAQEVLCDYGTLNLIYTVVLDDGRPAIVHWAEQTDEVLSELIIILPQETINKIKNNEIALRTAYLSGDIYLTQLKNNQDRTFFNVELVDIEEFLPVAGTFLLLK